MNLSKLSSKELLALHAHLGQELHKRGITRSSNNLTGDLAESLFCEAYKWHRADNSNRGYDATDKKGTRYQIKGRRCTGINKSHLLGAIRNLADKPFNKLAVVIFSEKYEIQYAALIPREVVERLVKRQEHTNSDRLVLNEGCEETGVVVVTDKLSAVAIELLGTSNAFPNTPSYKLLET